MKFTISINQEKLVNISPEATLVEGAVIDFLHWFCGSPSPKIEKMRVTGPDGIRYTWLNYDYLLNEMPLIGSRSKPTLSRVVARLEDWKLIRSLNLQHYRKYVTMLPRMDELYKTVDKYPSTFHPRNANVSPMKRYQAHQRFTHETNHSTTDKDMRDPVGRVYNSGRTGRMESVGAIIKHKS